MTSFVVGCTATTSVTVVVFSVAFLTTVNREVFFTMVALVVFSTMIDIVVFSTVVATVENTP